MTLVITHKIDFDIILSFNHDDTGNIVQFFGSAKPCPSPPKVKPGLEEVEEKEAMITRKNLQFSVRNAYLCFKVTKNLKVMDARKVLEQTYCRLKSQLYLWRRKKKKHPMKG